MIERGSFRICHMLIFYSQKGLLSWAVPFLALLMVCVQPLPAADKALSSEVDRGKEAAMAKERKEILRALDDAQQELEMLTREYKNRDNIAADLRVELKGDQVKFLKQALEERAQDKRRRLRKDAYHCQLMERLAVEWSRALMAKDRLLPDDEGKLFDEIEALASEELKVQQENFDRRNLDTAILKARKLRKTVRLLQERRELEANLALLQSPNGNVSDRTAKEISSLRARMGYLNNEIEKSGN